MPTNIERIELNDILHEIVERFDSGLYVNTQTQTYTSAVASGVNTYYFSNTYQYDFTYDRDSIGLTLLNDLL